MRRPSRARGAFHRRGPLRTPFRTPTRRAATAGQRVQPPHVFIDVRKPRLDPCSFAIRERLQGRVRHFGFCKWMFPRARLGTARTSRTTGVVGTTAMLDRESPRDPATAEGSQGQGSRAPSLDAPHRDCSRRRLRPNPDRFGHLLSRLPPSSRSGVTWGESDAANAARACKARVARGSCDARFPRRSRTFTNPRGLLSSAVRGANGEASLRTGKLFGDRIQRFFHHRGGARGTPARLLRWLGLPTRKSGEPPCCRRPQRPLTTSAFE
jgi:hypothetical protein